MYVHLTDSPFLSLPTLKCSYGSAPRAWEIGIMRDLDTCAIGLPSAAQNTIHHRTSGRPRSTSPLDSPVSVNPSLPFAETCQELAVYRSSTMAQAAHEDTRPDSML